MLYYHYLNLLNYTQIIHTEFYPYIIIYLYYKIFKKKHF